MKQHTHTHQRSICKLIMCFAVNILLINCVNAQKDELGSFLTPNGYFDKVFDDKGTVNRQQKVD